MRTPLLATLLTVVAAGSQLGATDCGAIINDQGFDLWCGDQLCAWDLERGDIRRAGTWHEGDDAVELLGSDTAISQLTAVTSYDTACIRFEMLASIAESTEVRLEADVFGDGTVDWSERIPTSAWDQVSFAIRVEGDYQGIRFRLTKNGAGTAVLARIGAWTADDCPAQGIEPTPRPDGATCDQAADCASGVCWSDAICSECATDADCADGQICGHSGPVTGQLLMHQICMAPASRALAEACLEGDECASGVCHVTACGECEPGSTCGDGRACTAVSTLDVAMCGPGQGDRARGEACFTGADCASGACDGPAIGLCQNAWLDTVCTTDDHCPADGNGTRGPCTFLGAAGGTCQ